MSATVHADPYPSRVQRRPADIERSEPVVWGPARGALTAEQRTQFATDGYLTLPGFLDAARVEQCRTEVERLRTRADRARWPETVREPDSHIVRSVFAVHQRSELLDEMTRDRQLLAILGELLDSDVYIHQSRVNYKPGFNGREFYWHSDFETWHVEDGMPQMRAVSAVISLTDNIEHNGPLLIIPGSHRTFVSCVGETPEEHYRKSLRRQEYGVPDRASLERLLAAADGRIDSVTGPAGTLVLFDSNCMHGSNSNITPLPRTNLFVVFNSVHNRLEQPSAGLRPRPEHVAARLHTAPLSAA